MATKPTGRTGGHPERKRRARWPRPAILLRDGKARHAPPENSRPPPLPGRAACGPIANPEGRGAVLSDGEWIQRARRRVPLHVACRLCRQQHETGDVLWRHLQTNYRTKGIDAEGEEILVEVAKLRRDDDGLDPGPVRPFDQGVARPVTGRIVVADDVEPPQRVGEQDGGEVGRGECRQHRHVGKDLPNRQNGLDAVARCHHVATDAKADRVAEKIAHRAPGLLERCLAKCSFVEAVWIEPGAMRARDAIVEIGNGGDHRRPCLGRRMLVGAIEAARVETQASGSADVRNAAFPQIRLYVRADDWLRDTKQSSCCFGRTVRCRTLPMLPARLPLRWWNAEKGPGLADNVFEVEQSTALADDVEKIAMLTGRGVGLMCS
jgi:hypothetical protein